MKSFCNIYIGTSIIISVTMGFGIIYIIRQRPKPTNVNFLYNILHYGISRYSRLQRWTHKYIHSLYQNKYFKKTIKYFEDTKYIFKNYFLNDIDVIKYNKILLRCKVSNLIQYNPLYMDFFIYSDIHSYPVNKKVCKDVYSFVKRYEKCDFKFGYISLILSEKYNYVIKLSNSSYNYYIVGNVIDKYLILFLLYQQYGVYIDHDNPCYTLEILDHTMSLFFLTEKDEIIFTKSSYNIKNVFYLKEDASDEKNILDGDKISDHIFYHNREDISKNSLSDSFVEI